MFNRFGVSTIIYKGRYLPSFSGFYCSSRYIFLISLQGILEGLGCNPGLYVFRKEEAESARDLQRDASCEATLSMGARGH